MAARVLWPSRCMLSFTNRFLGKLMSTSPHTTIVLVATTPAAEDCLCESEPHNRCGQYSDCERLLAAQAMVLLIRLDRDLRKARAQFNQDWFRRIMRARPKAVSRLRRRCSRIVSPPRFALGSLRRRYHANIAKYLYTSHVAKPAANTGNSDLSD